MSATVDSLGLDRRPHMMACSYRSEQAALEVFDRLRDRGCENASSFRLELPGGACVASCADDDAAAAFMARLDWGDGSPVKLPADGAWALVERRRTSAPMRHAGERRKDPASEIVPCSPLHRTDEPWPVEGGIYAIRCDSLDAAEAAREHIVAEHLGELCGLLVAFGRSGSAVLAAVSDTPGSAVLAREWIDGAEVATEPVYPDSDGAYALWAVRQRNGQASVPVSGAGSRDDLQAFLTGRVRVTPAVRAHAPRRNDPCPCGSGAKYKRCCGSGN
jgi:hypothetical protein